MDIVLIQAPVATGTTQKGMALAPPRYLAAGLGEVLKGQGHTVRTVDTAESVSSTGDLESVVSVNSSIARHVREAVGSEAVPLILGGACNVCLGAISGLEPPKVGVVWLDAHGDFNTPETSLSGYFDGMPLAIATGRAYQDLYARVGQSGSVRDMHTLLVGVRDLDPEEEAALSASEIQVVTGTDLQERGIQEVLTPALERLSARVSQIYLHLDIDVLDSSVAPGVNFPTSAGLSLAQLDQILDLIGSRIPVAAASLTALDPTKDPKDETLRVAMHCVEKLAASIGRQRA
ncbi:MAG: arginase family protein [Chloroflexota bacterium]|nr:arginase family protein [Chloroflexota bacterium]